MSILTSPNHRVESDAIARLNRSVGPHHTRGSHMTMKSSVSATITVAIACLATLFNGTDAIAAEIKLLASPGVRGAISELLREFESSTGHKIVADFAVIAVLKRRIDSGETFDVVIPSPSLVDDLIKQGKVAADTRTAFGRTGLGVAVPKGAPKPDISMVENLKRALLNARSVAYSKEGASGTNFLEVLNLLGIADEMRSKLKPSTSVSDAIEKGEADMAVTGMGPAMEMPGYVGGLPPEVQRYVTFGAGVSTTTKNPEAARALLRFLTSPNAVPMFKAKGLEPGMGQ